MNLSEETKAKLWLWAQGHPNATFFDYLQILEQLGTREEFWDTWHRFIGADD
jgi:hypothetical protein